tara:strand:- start:17 stop:151 length:135 start_codon:yes stop_codon:yes gene_type:complete
MDPLTVVSLLSLVVVEQDMMVLVEVVQEVLFFTQDSPLLMEHIL